MKHLPLGRVALAAVLMASACLNPTANPHRPSEDGVDGGDAGVGVDDGGLATLDGSDNTDNTVIIGYPYEPNSPAVYVPKVKNMLTGLPATDAEVQAVVADPNALRGLIDGWMALPEFQVRAQDFFRIAFQQSHVSTKVLAENLGMPDGVMDQGVNRVNYFVNQLILNLQDSFALTVMQLIKEGKPLTEAITTRRYMMTTLLMSYYAFADEMVVNDNKARYDDITQRLLQRNAFSTFTRDPASTATMAQSLDPGSPNYMIWRDQSPIPTGCSPDKIVDTSDRRFQRLFEFMYGRTYYLNCPGNVDQLLPQFSESDWNDWRMVEFKPTDATTPNTTPVFYDILKIRPATSLYLHTPRMGFFGTLAFQANWGTNKTNEARVTANQALIVALGRSINGANSVVNFPVSVNTGDAAHASDPACSGCHLQIDPLKQYFRQSYSIYYSPQNDTSQLSLPAAFNVDGVTATGTGVADLAATLASHPRFALAWTQKLYQWATSTPAMEDDPELVRIAMAFQQNNFDFPTLVRELFSSPLVTLATGTQTTQQRGVIVSIIRRDQFCTTLSNRLGLGDLCVRHQATYPTNFQKNVQSVSVLLPVDNYFRAYELPSLPTDPDLFFRASVERLCGYVDTQVVDGPAPSRYKGTDPTAAIADMVATVMGIPPTDPRSASFVQVLTDNYNAAKATGVSATDALRATFDLACIAPSSVLVGL